MFVPSGNPVLSSLILTRGGVFKHSYRPPGGLSFADDVEGWIVFTDRAGGVYEGSPFRGEGSASGVEWAIPSDQVDHIPSGANFEVFVVADDLTHKVQFGRVVRKEVQFPLNPLTQESAPLMYEDDLQRSLVGSRWVAKYGRVAMHQPPGAPDWGMGARNNLQLAGIGVTLFAQAATLWYAPTQSDTIEISVGLCDGGDGDTTIVLCSNYSMTSFLGVRFHDAFGAGDNIQVVTGTAWNSLTTQGSSYSHIVPDNGTIYTIRYSLPLNKVSIWTGPPSGGPVKEWTDVSNVVNHGAGFRYAGAIFSSSFTQAGPLMYYWKLKDAV